MFRFLPYNILIKLQINEHRWKVVQIIFKVYPLSKILSRKQRKISFENHMKINSFEVIGDLSSLNQLKQVKKERKKLTKL